MLTQCMVLYFSFGILLVITDDVEFILLHLFLKILLKYWFRQVQLASEVYQSTEGFVRVQH